MKTRSLFFSLIFAVSGFAFLASCSGNKDKDTAEMHDAHDGHEKSNGRQAEVKEATEPQFQVDQKFQDQLAGLFSSYVDLKEAFVDSNAEKVQEEASLAEERLEDVNMKLLSGAAHNDWMNYLTPIQNSLEQMQTSEDIETQRKAFSSLSENLYKSVKAFGLGGKEAYYEYCPMAFNNQGAYWLSNEQKIRNPYFGEKMLTCGEVKEKLQ